MLTELFNLCIGYIDFEVYSRCFKDKLSLKTYTKYAYVKKEPTIEEIFKNDWLFTMIYFNTHERLQNPECYAAKIGSLKILNYFLIESNKQKKYIIIHIACKHGHTNLVKHMVITYKIKITEALLKIAYDNQQKDTLKYLYHVFQEHLKMYLNNI